MKSRDLLPWGKAETKNQIAEIKKRVFAICAFCLLLSVFISGCGKEAEQARQRAEKELETVRAELEEVKAERTNLQTETARLRKDTEDLLRLRNEIRQLRDAQKQLTQQAQTAQTEIQRAQAQTQAAQAQAAQVQAQALAHVQAAQAAQAQALALGTNTAQVLTPEQQAFAARYGLNPQAVSQLNGCINNMRQLDGAKQQWALENRKTENAVPTAQDLGAYLKVFPKCPAGGSYLINAVNALPTCSIPGHALSP